MFASKPPRPERWTLGLLRLALVTSWASLARAPRKLPSHPLLPDGTHARAYLTSIPDEYSPRLISRVGRVVTRSVAAFSGTTVTNGYPPAQCLALSGHGVCMSTSFPNRVDVVPDGIYSHDHLSHKEHKEIYSINSRLQPHEAQDSIKPLSP